MASTTLPDVSKAAVLNTFNESLEIVDLPIPRIEPNAVLVKVVLATVCASDVHMWDGSIRTLQSFELPVIPGHELVGEIVAFGEGAHVDSVGTPLAVGDRIVFSHGNCGTCKMCSVLHQPNLCRNRQRYMYSRCDEFPYLVGGFAEYCYVFPTAGRIRVPDDIKTEWASAASCALRSAILSFMQLGAIEVWQTLVIQGSGPLGLFATAIAQRSGVGRVIVVGGPDDRLQVARSWGASETVSILEYPDPADRVGAVRELTSGGADIVMEFSGARTAFGEGLEMLGTGGRYVVTGQVGGRSDEVRPGLITRNQLTILGASSGDASHHWRAMRFLSETKEEFDYDQLLSNRYGLHEVTTALRRMKSFDEIKPIILPQVCES